MDVVAARPAHRTSLILELAHPHHERLVVGHDQAALAGRDGLVRRERKTAGAAERPETTAGMARSQRFRGVLDDRDAARRGDLEDAFDGRGASADVDRNDGTRPRRDRARERVRGDGQRRRIDVDEHRRRAGERHRVDGRDEGEVRHDDFVSAANAEGRGYHTIYRRVVAATISARAGRRDIARTELARAISATEGDSVMRLDLAPDEALLRLALGDRDRAEELVRGYLKARPMARDYFARELLFKDLHLEN